MVNHLAKTDDKWIRDFLSHSPRLTYLFKAGSSDLRRGLHNRRYQIGEEKAGLMMGATFDDGEVFYATGSLSERDLDWIFSVESKGEIHTEEDLRQVIASASDGRVQDFNRVRYYYLENPGIDHESSSCEKLGLEDKQEIICFFEKFYPENVFTARMLELTMFGVRSGGEIVSVGGTLYVDYAQKACQIGGFLTHPDHRGRGYSKKLARALISDLCAQGISKFRLEVYDSNRPAWSMYESLGFRIEDIGWEAPISDPNRRFR